jgi:hypothetical protein
VKDQDALTKRPCHAGCAKTKKVGAKVINHARRTVFQMAGAAVPSELFGEILTRIRELAAAPI